MNAHMYACMYLYKHLLDVTADIVHDQVMLLASPRIYVCMYVCMYLRIYTHLLDVTADVVHDQVMLLAHPRRRLARQSRASCVVYDKLTAGLGSVCVRARICVCVYDYV